MATEEKPALTVLVGAGASIPLGLPSTPAVTEYVTRGRSGDTPTGKLAGLEDDARDFLQNMHAVLIDRCARHSFGAPKKPNFEDLLHAAETVANLRETFLQRSAGSMAALLTGGPAGGAGCCWAQYRSACADDRLANTTDAHTQ